jgi:hypothetical protein
MLRIQMADNLQKGKYTIINLEGKALLKGSFATKTVDITGLPSGMYFMIFENEKGMVVGERKIVKE